MSDASTPQLMDDLYGRLEKEVTPIPLSAGETCLDSLQRHAPYVLLGPVPALYRLVSLHKNGTPHHRSRKWAAVGMSLVSQSYLFRSTSSLRAGGLYDSLRCQLLRLKLLFSGNSSGFGARDPADRLVGRIEAANALVLSAMRMFSKPCAWP